MTSVAGKVPKSTTAVSDEPPDEKPEPVMVTAVPPAPLAGVMEVTTGATAGSWVAPSRLR